MKELHARIKKQLIKNYPPPDRVEVTINHGKIAICVTSTKFKRTKKWNRYKIITRPLKLTRTEHDQISFAMGFHPA